MKNTFTYFGHSCFLMEVAGKKLLFDPFISPNEQAKEIDISQIEADYILVSHGHADHTADLVQLTLQTKAKVICSWEISEWLQKKGVTNVHPMNVGGKWTFDFGTVYMTFAAHSNSLPDGTYGGVAAGFIILFDQTCMYYAGDTGLTYEMKLLADLFKINTAILPLGDNFTMDYKQAALAAQFINCKNIIGVHFNTFDFIRINNTEAIDYFEKLGLNLTLPGIKQQITL